MEERVKEMTKGTEEHINATTTATSDEAIVYNDNGTKSRPAKDPAIGYSIEHSIEQDAGHSDAKTVPTVATLAKESPAADTTPEEKSTKDLAASPGSEISAPLDKDVVEAKVNSEPSGAVSGTTEEPAKQAPVADKKAQGINNERGAKVLNSVESDHVAEKRAEIHEEDKHAVQVSSGPTVPLVKGSSASEKTTKTANPASDATPTSSKTQFSPTEGNVDSQIQDKKAEATPQKTEEVTIPVIEATTTVKEEQEPEKKIYAASNTTGKAEALKSTKRQDILEEASSSGQKEAASEPEDNKVDISLGSTKAVVRDAQDTTATDSTRETISTSSVVVKTEDNKSVVKDITLIQPKDSKDAPLSGDSAGTVVTQTTETAKTTVTATATISSTEPKKDEAGVLEKAEHYIEIVADEVVKGVNNVVETVEQHPELIAEGAIAVAIGAASLIQPELIAGEIAVIGKMAQTAATASATKIAKDEAAKVAQAVATDLKEDKDLNGIKDALETPKEVPKVEDNAVTDSKSSADRDASKEVPTTADKEMKSEQQCTKDEVEKKADEVNKENGSKTIALEVAAESADAQSLTSGKKQTEPVSLKITIGADGAVRSVTQEKKASTETSEQAKAASTSAEKKEGDDAQASSTKSQTTQASEQLPQDLPTMTPPTTKVDKVELDPSRETEDFHIPEVQNAVNAVHAAVVPTESDKSATPVKTETGAMNKDSKTPEVQNTASDIAGTEVQPQPEYEIISKTKSEIEPVKESKTQDHVSDKSTQQLDTAASEGKQPDALPQPVSSLDTNSMSATTAAQAPFVTVSQESLDHLHDTHLPSPPPTAFSIPTATSSEPQPATEEPETSSEATPKPSIITTISEPPADTKANSDKATINTAPSPAVESLTGQLHPQSSSASGKKSAATQAQNHKKRGSVWEYLWPFGGAPTPTSSPSTAAGDTIASASTSEVQGQVAAESSRKSGDVKKSYPAKNIPVIGVEGVAVPSIAA